MTDKRPPLKPLERSVFTSLSHVILAAWDKVQAAWFRWAELNQHSPWFPIYVALIVGFDAMVVVLPGDVIVALATLSNPNNWKRLALWSGLGGALGAFALYLLLHLYGTAPMNEINKQLADLGAPPSVQEVSDLDGAEPDDVDEAPVVVPGKNGKAVAAPVIEAPKPPKAPRWQAAKAFFDKYGLFSLALGSLIPFLSWPPVVLAGLSSDKWFQVLIYLLIGRLVRYFILCFGLREGWAMFTTLRQEAKQQKELREQQKHGGG